MVIDKGSKIDIDDLLKDDVELTEKAKAVLSAIVELHNSGKENITNQDVAEATSLGIRQVVGVVNGLIKKVDIKRGKAKIMVEKEVTTLEFGKGD